MKVLLFHPVLLPRPNYGGVERVVLWLARGLQEKGHEVFIAALAGSQLPKGIRLIEVERKNYSLEEWVTFLPKSLDLIHFMAPISAEIFDNLPIPAVLTVHGNGKIGEVFPKNSVFLSKDHATRHGALQFVYNGIDPSEYLFQPDSKENWNLFLSKTNWSVKNVKGAIRYSRLAEQKLKVAGGNRPWLERLQCKLNPTFQWMGPVDSIKKAELLTRAKALLMPVLWPEPFGLVIAEALISGTPVIGSPRGSLKELIPQGVGCLPSSESEWIEVLQRKVYPGTPEDCRKWAIENFHFLKMTENYEKIYLRVLSGEVLNPENPKTRSIEENLSWRKL